MGASVPPIETDVPANWVLKLVVLTSVAGPRPVPNRVIISPGEIGMVASPLPEAGAEKGWIVAPLAIAPIENGTGVSLRMTAFAASATYTLPALSSVTPYGCAMLALVATPPSPL